MTEVYIRTSYATAHCAIATTGVAATMVEATEKAFQFQAYDEVANKPRVFWLPRKALVKKWERDGMVGYELAKWFKPEGYTQFIFERCSSTLSSVA